MSDLTQILARVEQGDGEAAAQLLPLVYEELRSLAAARMAREPPGHRLLLARETMPCCRASTSPVGTAEGARRRVVSVVPAGLDLDRRHSRR